MYIHSIRITILSALLPLLACNADSLLTVGDAYSGTSVNATIFRRNSIVSQNGWQFVSYYDNDARLCIAKRRQNDSEFKIWKSRFSGSVTDAHNVISMGIDGDGFLHVAFDHHNNKLHYCRSIEPYSAELGEEESMLGHDEDKVTYPEFYSLKGGDLLFVYRSGESGQGNLVMNRYNVRTRMWQRLHDVLLDGEGQRNAYWQMCVDAQGIIHLSWVWRETWDVATNHDLCYACSRDGGITWEKSTGEHYQLPITAGNAEYAFRIPQNSELINQTSMAADNHSQPYIATYWKAPSDSAPQYKLVYRQDGRWTVSNVGHRTHNFSLSGGGTKMIPMSRPQIAITTTQNHSEPPRTSIFYIYRDAETGSRVTVAHTDNLISGNWTVSYPHNLVVDAWEPSYDTNLWNHPDATSRPRLNLYVQQVLQGDGEKTVSTPPHPVMVLELK